jgi:hypothetical protein
LQAIQLIFPFEKVLFWFGVAEKLKKTFNNKSSKMEFCGVR